MGSKEELKRLRELHHRKGREEQRCFLVQGAKLVLELAGSGWPVEEVHVSEDASERWAHLKPAYWPAHVMDRIGTFEQGNEVVAVVRIPDEKPLTDPAANELILALDGVADPGNLGTVLRIDDLFGVRRVFLADGSVDPFNP